MNSSLQTPGKHSSTELCPQPILKTVPARGEVVGYSQIVCCTGGLPLVVAGSRNGVGAKIFQREFQVGQLLLTPSFLLPCWPMRASQAWTGLGRCVG